MAGRKEQHRTKEIADADLAPVRDAHGRFKRACGAIRNHGKRKRALEEKELLARYDLGAAIAAVEKKYGQATVVTLAKTLEENDTLLRRCSNVAGTWSRARFEELVADGLSWTNAFFLAEVSDERVRCELEKIVDLPKNELVQKKERLIDADEGCDADTNGGRHAPAAESAAQADRSEDTNDDKEARRLRELRARVDVVRTNGLALIEGLRDHAELMTDFAVVVCELWSAIPAQCRDSMRARTNPGRAA